MVYGPLDSYQKSGKTNDPILRKVQKTSFWAILGPNLPKKKFFQTVYGPLDSYQKSGKTNDPISRNVEKTSFLGHFGPKLTHKFFFRKSASGRFESLLIFIFLKKKIK